MYLKIEVLNITKEDRKLDSKSSRQRPDLKENNHIKHQLSLDAIEDYVHQKPRF